jgi:hypothetical protein
MKSPLEDSHGWLSKTCNLLKEDRWSVEIPLSFDGADFRNSSLHGPACSSLFFDSLCRWGKARELRIKNLHLNQREKESISHALRSNRTLERLSITNVSSVEKGIFFDTSRSIMPDNNLLHDFTLDRCQIGDQDLTFIHRILAGASIRTLKLRNMALDGLLSEISSSLSKCTSLVMLDVSGSCISTDSLKILCQALSINDHLKSLTLSGCGIGSTVWQDHDLVLSKNSSLETLDLSNNDIDGDMVSYLTHGGLKSNKSLRTLVLSRNPIGDDGVRGLVSLLISNPSVRSLSLIDCETWGPGCSALASGLARMTGLRDLYVDREMEDFADEVLASLQCNTTLRHLWTGCTARLVQRDPTWRIVEYYLHLNRCKRQALLESGMPVALFPHILEGVSSTPALTYYFLRQKPDLVRLA